MMPKRTGGKPPPAAVYALGKRKQAITVAIKALRSLYLEVTDQKDIDKVTDVILMLERRRKKLDEV